VFGLWVLISQFLVSSLIFQILWTLYPRFSDPDRSLNRKKERFKVFEVEPRSNWGRIMMTS